MGQSTCLILKQKGGKDDNIRFSLNCLGGKDICFIFAVESYELIVETAESFVVSRNTTNEQQQVESCQLALYAEAWAWWICYLGVVFQRHIIISAIVPASAFLKIPSDFCLCDI